MITELSGDILAADVEALVNAVNTAGVMGKGLALQFKRAYPEMFADYARAAAAGELVPGRVHVWETGLPSSPRFVLNVPTKRHWRSPSSLEIVEAGLQDLARVVRERGIRSVAVPALGCGLGGLTWGEVRPRIETALAPLDDVDVLLFGPGEQT